MNSIPRIWGYVAASLLCVVLAVVAVAQGVVGLRPGQSGRATLRELPTSATLVSPDKRPMHQGRVFNLATSQKAASADVYRVPAGTRLVIEFVSFSYIATAGSGNAVLRYRLGTTNAGIQVFHDISTFVSMEKWAGESKPVKIYADPDSVVSVIVDREFHPPATIRVSISGYFEPIGGTKPGIG